jgi:hypothetical protein
MNMEQVPNIVTNNRNERTSIIVESAIKKAEGLSMRSIIHSTFKTTMAQIIHITKLDRSKIIIAVLLLKSYLHAMPIFQNG